MQGPFGRRFDNSRVIADLVHEHYDRVYSFCARRVGPELGSDAAQETFVTAQKTWDRFEGRSSVETWLLGIAHNHCRNLARKMKMEPLSLEHWMTPGDDQQNALIDKEALRQAMRRLSPEHREVVLMHEVEGLKYREVADVLGIPEGTVKSRLYHAFAELRVALVGREEVQA